MADTPMTRAARLRSLVPLGVVVAAVAVALALGVHRHISIDAVAVHYAGFADFVADNPIRATLLGFLFYALATGFSFPAAWMLTVTMGVVFGWQWGGTIVLFAATTGASMLYWVARTGLRAHFSRVSGRQLTRMAEGFRANAINFMLFLRLAPILPFAVVNVVPGILGVSYPVFVVTTFIGIIPGTIAYTFAGEGLRSVVIQRAEACAAGIPPCGQPLSPGDLITPQMVIALTLLAVVSLLPVAIKAWRSR